MAEEPSKDDFEKLFVNNPDIDRIRAYLMEFNPIKVMKMENVEIRHSNILAWLMNPQESHGLGDHFLKAFLAEALREQKPDLDNPSALEVAEADMLDAEINREWKEKANTDKIDKKKHAEIHKKWENKSIQIDILVISRKNKWVFVIENKFKSQQSKGQLQVYFDTCEREFPKPITKKVVGVFLTLEDEEPGDKRYVSISYDNICNLLKNHILSDVFLLNKDVKIFLDHYLNIIKEESTMNGKDEEMKELAKEIYSNHSAVIDFIVEHGKANNFLIAFGELIVNDRKLEDLKPYVANKNESPDKFELDMGKAKRKFIFGKGSYKRIALMPESWYNELNRYDDTWEDCRGWWMEFPLIMWLQFDIKDGVKGILSLIAEVGPYHKRLDLIKKIKKKSETNEKVKKITFTKKAQTETGKYSKFFKENSKAIDNIHNPEKISEAIITLFKEFTEEIDVVGDALKEFVDHLKETEQ